MRALGRFLSRYGNVRTKALYSIELAMYLRWLRAEGNRFVFNTYAKRSDR
jgi:hypothetical protein